MIFKKQLQSLAILQLSLTIKIFTSHGAIHYIWNCKENFLEEIIVTEHQQEISKII